MNTKSLMQSKVWAPSQRRALFFFARLRKPFPIVQSKGVCPLSNVVFIGSPSLLGFSTLSSYMPHVIFTFFFPHDTWWVFWGYPTGIMGEKRRRKGTKIHQFLCHARPYSWGILMAPKARPKITGALASGAWYFKNAPTLGCYLTLRSGLADYANFLTVLYDIIFQWRLHTCNCDQKSVKMLDLNFVLNHWISLPRP